MLGSMDLAEVRDSRLLGVLRNWAGNNSNEEDKDEDSEYHENFESMSNDNYFSYDNDTSHQAEILNHNNNQVYTTKNNEQFFGSNLFNNPFQAVEDQENNSGGYLYLYLLKPVEAQYKTSPISKTPIQHFLAKKTKLYMSQSGS
ncbi:predicted protein [Sclerotinia sclerotiorum 1980 UF-70]|uniref:Uncharacterized protein n=1 Tax=Sclerotinia sclerotiorum (strain ATCC 18683 / 1980 / Ss-1) TaxID=665079 RepID=A7E820_SCLS1|nr:predicted protein [Sclerotinia sclerotiorum 1980 UF-70]EDN96522.1 predicted protein [Sclerotinia sclerotiorum 1980 UF-70]